MKLWSSEEEELLCSVPGIGQTTAHVLPAELPELGEAGRQEIVKLVGVAPLNTDSGRRRGQRTTWGGRASVRSALYVATLVATRHNRHIRNFYERLIDRGKAKKKAPGDLQAQTTRDPEHDGQERDALESGLALRVGLTIKTVAIPVCTSTTAVGMLQNVTIRA